MYKNNILSCINNNYIYSVNVFAFKSLDNKIITKRKKENQVYLCKYVSYIFQDIIENEDIKLDDMFIASLIHDLIKVDVFEIEKNKLL